MPHFFLFGLNTMCHGQLPVKRCIQSKYWDMSNGKKKVFEPVLLGA